MMKRQVPQITALIKARGILSSREALTSLFTLKKKANPVRKPSRSPSTTPVRAKTWGLASAGFQATDCPVPVDVGVEADGSCAATTCPLPCAVAPA